MSESSLAPQGETFAVKDLVAYGEGAVVSRTIVKQPTGTMTVFAFDIGQELSEHTAPFDAVVEVLEGEVDLIIGGKPVRANTGQTVIMPANISHSVKAVTKFKMLLTMIRG